MIQQDPLQMQCPAGVGKAHPDLTADLSFNIDDNSNSKAKKRCNSFDKGASHWIHSGGKVHGKGKGRSNGSVIQNYNTQSVPKVLGSVFDWQKGGWTGTGKGSGYGMYDASYFIGGYDRTWRSARPNCAQDPVAALTLDQVNTYVHNNHVMVNRLQEMASASGGEGQFLVVRVQKMVLRKFFRQRGKVAEAEAVRYGVMLHDGIFLICRWSDINDFVEFCYFLKRCDPRGNARLRVLTTSDVGRILSDAVRERLSKTLNLIRRSSGDRNKVMALIRDQVLEEEGRMNYKENPSTQMNRKVRSIDSVSNVRSESDEVTS